VWLYHRFCLSFREVEEILAEGGATVTFEAVRQRTLDLTMLENSKIGESLCPKQFLPEG
jgi:transposase-like protein